MNIVKRGILLLFVITFSLHADFQVIVKAAKNRADLTPYIQEVKDRLSTSLANTQITVVKSPHPVWKWRLGIVHIRKEDKARAVLPIVKRYYPDAYLVNNNNPTTHEYKKPYKKRKKVEKTIEINFTDLSIVEFVKIVSKVTGKNILISQDIEGNVNFVGTKPIKERKLLTLLNQVLLSKKLTLLDTNDGYLKIVNSSDALKSGPQLSTATSIDQIQTAILPLKTLKAMDIIKQANSLVSKSGKISISNDTNSIIITDFPNNINAIREIISTLNTQGGHDKVIKFIHFQNTDVESVFTKVSQMTRAYFNSYAKSQQVKAIKSNSSNSIILVGNPKSIQRVISSIKEFDQASSQKEKDVEMILIKNTDAAEISKILSQLISNEEFSENIENMSGSSKTATKKDSKTKVKRLVQLHKSKRTAKSSIKITYDKQLNAVMLFGTQKEREVLKKLIQKLDTERKQVYVKARILEINNQKASQIGMQYGIIGGVSNSSGLYALSSKLGLDAQTGIGLAKGLNLTLPNASKVLALGAAISLLSENSAADIISEPSILCINNEESSIYVGKTISVVSQSSVATTTTDINRNTYSREDIGLTLNILPRISSDNKVTLGIKITSEDILPGSAAGLPKTTKRVVKTSAIVNNGESVIIGGMSREKESTTKSGIPVLKNLPIVGKLFEKENVDRERTTLVLVLTPYIINHSTDLSELKEELGKLYSFEKNFAHSVSSCDKY